ncbi:MAG: hypothetical protein GX893_00345 [Firmicutes bacterium]|nr:hypothetical protein [Bacillota bacterium]
MLFKYLETMQPISTDTIPLLEQYLYQVKWDGVRIIAHIGGQKVWLHNRRFKERTFHYPELKKLSQLVKGDAILDGDLVAFQQGKPNFPLLLKRDLLNPNASAFAYKIKRLMKEIPVYYLVFDLLYHNGFDLRQKPLWERQGILQEILTTDDTVNCVESFSDGESLFQVVTAQKLEGVVAKAKDSHYIAGKKHRLWWKIKRRQQLLVAIGGYTEKNGQINALLVGAYFQNRFFYLGRVATGLSNQDLVILNSYLKAMTTDKSPFVNLPQAAKSYKWVIPQLTVLINFQEWTEDMRMRQPVIQGFTKNRPEECILS